ncbi:NACHT domain-containing protein [Saccharopolyspora shandongensis]|uniref:NACHT domain-containing protein n=1 Tax=Saccharopolyspora shandongensis TaxID=418495 RepID=UPI0033F550DA
MSGLEASALRAGGTVIKHVATAWLSRKKAESRRGAELTELIALRLGGLRERERRALRRKLEEVGELAGERLEELCAREFADLADNERLAALDAVVDALDDADLSDTALLGTDLDPMALAKKVKCLVPPAPARAGLNEAARALFDRALDLCCVQLVHLVRELPEFDSRLAEESLCRTTSILSGVDEILDRLPTISLDAPTGTDHDAQFRRRYLDVVAKHHDDLELIGVSIRNFRPKTNLSVAYLSLTVSGGEPQQLDDPHVEPWFTQDQPGGGTLRVEAALRKSERTLVRGEAGSGKSTLLRWIAVQAARGGFGTDLARWNGRIPIVIKLRSYSGRRLPKPEHFLDESSLMTGPVPDGWIHRSLLDGHVLLLVDGVDELTRAERPKVQRWLDSVLKSYPMTSVVVTSRPAAASTKWLQAEGFVAVDLERMTPADVQEFLARWHRALLAADSGHLPFSSSDVEAHHRGLLAKLDARAHLRNLARSPLMCAMLCALNLDRNGDLPRDRKSLYEAALEMVLDRRETVRGIPASDQITLGYREKLLLLQDLAFFLNLNGRAEVDRTTALDRVGRKLDAMPGVDISADDCLNYLLERSGVIREATEGRIDFVHRTFQEFLAAREAAEDGHVGLLIDKAQSDQWRETVVMAAGLLNRPGRAELLTGILDRADRSGRKTARKLRLLTATCCESVHELPGELSTRIESCLDSLVPPRSTWESRSLAMVGESILARLPADTTGLSAAQAAACTYTAALVNGPNSLPLLATYAADGRIEVQDEVIDAWPLYAPEDYATTVLSRAPLHHGRVLIRHSHLLPHVGGLQKLESTMVNLEDDDIRDLRFAADLPSLRSLRVYTSRQLSTEGIADHPALKSLTLVCSRLNGVTALHGLPALTNLFLNKGAGFSVPRFLAGLPQLEFLRIGLSPDADPRPFANLHELRSLMLDSYRAIEVLTILPHPEKMRRLSILKPRPQPVGFISRLFPGLNALHMHGPTELAELELERLTCLKTLEVRPEGNDFAVLEALPGLRSLTLNGTRTLDLSSLRNENLSVLVPRDAVIEGADLLPAGTSVKRRNLNLDRESARKARRSFYKD